MKFGTEMNFAYNSTMRTLNSNLRYIPSVFIVFYLIIVWMNRLGICLTAPKATSYCFKHHWHQGTIERVSWLSSHALTPLPAVVLWCSEVSLIKTPWKSHLYSLFEMRPKIELYNASIYKYYRSRNFCGVTLNAFFARLHNCKNKFSQSVSF